MLNEKTKQIIHVTYGIFLSVITIVAAICIMVSCFNIYRTDSYSREAVGIYFSKISAWVYLCLDFVLGGFILNLVIPFAQKKKPTRQTAMVLARLYEKIDWDQCDPQLVQTIKKEQKSRIMCYTIIVQSWTFAMGAVFGAEKASQTAPFVVPLTMERR